MISSGEKKALSIIAIVVVLFVAVLWRNRFRARGLLSRDVYTLCRTIEW